MVGDCDTRVDVQLLGLVHMEYQQLEIIDVLMAHRGQGRRATLKVNKAGAITAKCSPLCFFASSIHNFPVALPESLDQTFLG